MLAAGQPTRSTPPTWSLARLDFARYMELTSRKGSFSETKLLEQRRGSYRTLHTGVSFGGGQEVSPALYPQATSSRRRQHPMNLVNKSLRNQELVRRLLKSASVQRFVNFSARLFILTLCPSFSHIPSCDRGLPTMGAKAVRRRQQPRSPPSPAPSRAGQELCPRCTCSLHLQRRPPHSHHPTPRLHEQSRAVVLYPSPRKLQP